MNTSLRCFYLLLAMAVASSCSDAPPAGADASASAVADVGPMSDAGSATDVGAPVDVGTPPVDAGVAGEDAGLVAPVLEVSPAKLEFGTVEVGSSKTLSLTLRNVGPTGSVLRPSIELGQLLGRITLEGPPAGSGLAAGESVEVRLTFAPEIGTSFALPLVVQSNDPARSRVEVPVAGEGKGGAMLIAPNELDFGGVGADCESRERSFTVYNAGNAEMTLQTVEVKAGSSPDFHLVMKPRLPWTLAAGTSVDFRAKYAPQGDGADEGSLVFIPTKGAVAEVPLRGHTVPWPPQTDVFVQDPAPEVDVLFLIDDSPSMADERAALLANLGAYYDFLAATDIDFHLAVTTTGVDVAHGGLSTPAGGAANGCILPLTGTGPKVITRQTSNAKQAFLQNVDVGTSGSDDEFLIRPAVLAVTEPNLSGCNAGFVRANASLAVWLISDSPDMDTGSVDAYVASLLGLKGLTHQDRFTFSAAVPKGAQAAQCTPETGALASTRALETVQKTSGGSEDLCKDWLPALEKIGMLAFGIRTKFFLSNVPDPVSSITVAIDGVALAAVGPGGETRWSFEAATNSIQFQPGWVPAAGTTVTVSYTTACLQ